MGGVSSRGCSRSSPPSLTHKPSRLLPLLTPLRAIFGLFLTLLSGIALVFVTPFLLLLKAFFILRDGRTLPSCDVNWPLAPYTHAALFLNRNIDIASVTNAMQQAVLPADAVVNFSNPHAHFEVGVWDHRRRMLFSATDITNYFSSVAFGPPKHPPLKMLVADDVMSGPFDEASVLLIHTHPSLFSFCALRTISALTQGLIAIEMEPRLYHPFYTSQGQHFNLLLAAVSGMCRFIQFVFYAPMSICGSFRHPPCVDWTLLEDLSNDRPLVSVRREHGNSEKSAETEMSNLVPRPLSTHKEQGFIFSYMKMDQLECVQRTERLLRATSAELLISLFSGALRVYMRGEGVKHPNCVEAAIPVSLDERSCIETHSKCKSLLLNVRLPTGVEGAIPRLWTLQRRMASEVESVTPIALQAGRHVGSFLFTPEMNTRVNRNLYNDCKIQVAFIRVKGESMLDGNSLQCLCLVPPLVPPVRASFLFIQTNHSLLFASSVDNFFISDPNKLMDLFAKEVRNLMDHLAFRLLTLTQISYFPDRNFCRSDDDDDISSESPSSEYPSASSSSARMPSIRRKPSVDNIRGTIAMITEKVERMDININEDDKRNKETVDALVEFEDRMDNLQTLVEHDLEYKGLGLEEELERTCARVAEKLAPFKAHARRFSREFSRLDPLPTPRRNSRSSNASTSMQ